MIEKIDITNEQAAEQVLELQRKSYKIEAEIINFYHIPPLIETLEELIKCSESFYGYYSDNNLCGIISYKKVKQVIDIHRVAIDPKLFKKGIAQKLISYIEALDESMEKAIVSTGEKNIPAIKLYEKLGYKAIRKIKAAENLYIVCFEKILIK